MDKRTSFEMEPLPLSLDRSLELVDSLFNSDQILHDAASDVVEAYYRQSLPGYERLYTDSQWMHVALSKSEELSPHDYEAQADDVAQAVLDINAERVLEIGCGLGSNLMNLAQRFPDRQFVGLDLMKQHVTRARKRATELSNVNFVQGSYEPIPAKLGKFDIIFAVETLCYAKDPDRVAATIAKHLKPGGRIILFDGHRSEEFAALPASLQQATRLYEAATAVARGFHVSGRWERAFAGAGLTLRPTQDLTLSTWPGLLRLHQRSIKGFTKWKWRMAARVLPRFFVRNSVAGLLGVHACFGAVPVAHTHNGGVKYQRVEAVHQG